MDLELNTLMKVGSLGRLCHRLVGWSPREFGNSERNEFKEKCEERYFAAQQTSVP